MLNAVGRIISAPFRLIPWYVWIAGLAIAAWFGRNILLIIATIIAFHPIPVPPLFLAEPASLEDARLQDLEHFHHVRRNERSMDDAMRTRFDAAVQDLADQAGALTPAEFQLGLARVQALIDNGHSNASATRMVQAFPRFPIRTSWMSGELRVLRALPGHEDLLGARLTHIGDLPIDAVLTRFRDAFGGNEAFFLSFAPLLLDAPDYLAAVGVEETRLRFELLSGEIVERELEVRDPVEGDRRVFSGDLPQTWASEGEAWIAFQPSTDPMYMRRPRSGYWFEALPEMDAVYLALRQNIDDESGESLTEFVQRAEAEITELDPGMIIVDQRFNGGGDLTRTAPLMRALGEIVGPDGRIYLLSSGNTFSAAIVNMAMAKEAAPGRTVIVGEAIGDRLQFWAEGWWYSLPNSGFRARYSTGFYDLQNGCSGLFICPWGSLHIFPVQVDDLDVDMAAPIDFQAYAVGRDPGMEAVIAAERARAG